MKPTLIFARSMGTATCRMPSGRRVVLPIIPGILKHPSADMLQHLLNNPDVARKYTQEALRKAAWPVLRLFPKDWLLQCLPDVRMRHGRAMALEFMLNRSRNDKAADRRIMCRPK